MSYQDELSDYFSVTKFLLKTGGISLEPEESWSFKIYSRFLMLFNLFGFLQFIGVPRYLQTDKDVFEFILFEIVLLIILLKFVVTFYNRISLGIILKKLQSGLLKLDMNRGGIAEKMLIKECVARTKRQNIIYWILVTTSTVLGLIDSIVWRLTSNELNWRYEYGPFTMFNTSYSPNFEIAFLVHNFSWVMLGFMFTLSELLIVAVLVHLTYQLKVLQNSIKRIILNSYKAMMNCSNINEDLINEDSIDPSLIPWKYLQPIVEKTVKHHLSIIDLAEETEGIFNIFVMLILISAILIIAGFLYRFELVHVMGIACQLSEIGLICYWGNEVSLESQNVMDACYDINFIGSDIRLQKSMFLIMERSKRSITFTAGRFSALTLGTFLAIVRTAYSCLLVLQRMT